MEWFGLGRKACVYGRPVAVAFAFAYSVDETPLISSS
jgi:hypothetical protein